MSEQLSVDEVISEVQKLQYLFQLKRVIRYNEERADLDSTESVAEHIYGLYILMRYFLPLESKQRQLDEQKIWLMILWHDIDEIEVGDILGYRKTAEDIKREELAEQTVIEQSPVGLQTELREVLKEYRSQSSLEARFVKAIDKFEPLVHLRNKRGRVLTKRNKTTARDSLNLKTPYLNDFPTIKHFCLTIHKVMDEEGHFYEGK